MIASRHCRRGAFSLILFVGLFSVVILAAVDGTVGVLARAGDQNLLQQVQSEPTQNPIQQPPLPPGVEDTTSEQKPVQAPTKGSPGDNGFSWTDFFTSLPGILTGLAAVITAIGGAFLVGKNRQAGQNDPGGAPDGNDP